MQNQPEKPSNSLKKFLRDKGYYIVLALCVAAVGVSGYLFVRTASDQNTLPADTSLSVPLTVPEETTGSKTITLTVVHGDGTSNDITVSTDAENLRDALEAEGIIAGEDSSYGMFVQTVDGETADDGEQEWWCLTKGGEMWNYGVDDTEIADGDVYEFTLTVGY